MKLIKQCSFLLAVALCSQMHVFAMKRKNSGGEQEQDKRQKITNDQDNQSLLPRELWSLILAHWTPKENIAREFPELLVICKGCSNLLIRKNGTVMAPTFSIFKTYFPDHFFEGEKKEYIQNRISQITLKNLILHEPYTSMDEMTCGTGWYFDYTKLLLSLAQGTFNPDAQNAKYGNTLLHCMDECFTEDYSDWIVVLLKFGANPLVENNKHHCAFINTIHLCWNRIVQPGFVMPNIEKRSSNLLFYFLKYTSNINTRVTRSGEGLLHYIAKINPASLNALESRISGLNLNFNIKDNEDNTPLHCCIAYCFSPKNNIEKWLKSPAFIIATWLRLGADPKIKNSRGYNALELARYFHTENADNPKRLTEKFAQEIITMLDLAIQDKTRAYELLWIDPE